MLNRRRLIRKRATMNYQIKSTLIFAFLVIGCNANEPENGTYNQSQPMDLQTQSTNNLNKGYEEIASVLVFQGSFCLQMEGNNSYELWKSKITDPNTASLLQRSPCPTVIGNLFNIYTQCNPITSNINGTQVIIKTFFYADNIRDPAEIQQACSELAASAQQLQN